MKYILIISLSLICLLSAYGKESDIKSRLRNASNNHPRILLSQDDDVTLREKIDSHPVLSQTFSHVTALAESMLEVQPVTRKKIGRRLLRVSRRCLKRVLYLSLSYRLTDDKRYAVRAQEEMLAAANFSDWNPSHFLDVAEMTAALAIGYDWVYEKLDSETREIIKRAIIEKGLKTSLKGGWWVETGNNWNQVCHGGLVLGALAVLEDEPDLTEKIIERAVANVPTAMAEYSPDGAYPEGPGYWKYGTTYNVILIAALESVLGTDFGLSESKAFLESSDYYLHTTGPTGLFFNYSDSGLESGVSPAMYWFSAKRDASSLLWREQDALNQFLAQKHRSNDRTGRFVPLLLVWARPFAEIAAPEVLHWKAGGKTPVGIHRSGWKSSEEIFVGLKGGSPNTNHAHMDIGTFVMDAIGVRWAEDLGSQSYHELEARGFQLWDKTQEGQRWDVFRLNNFSHNTLVVNGNKQRVNSHAPIVRFTDKAPMPHTIIDMTTVYQDQLALAKRGIGLVKDQQVLIQDEIETLNEKTSVRWGMVTRAEVKLEGARQAVLKQKNHELILSVLSPTYVKLELFETAKPPHEYDAQNKGTRMIGFNADLPPSTKERLVILLTPGDKEGDHPAIRSFEDW